ncbi:hypothetical protein [Tessaracoccus coleopterorum]|uniref:hypothetical protein n=1 Tax=Tessaracoccus coleopterorum TaxID=2714950 RepID=UPI001E404CF7|nr:hypothetical protein [Tessaracoccus coleopterorum]
MSVLEMIYGTPAGKFVARKVGLSDPPVLRRGRVMPTGPVVLGELPGGGSPARPSPCSASPQVSPSSTCPRRGSRTTRAARCRPATRPGRAPSSSMPPGCGRSRSSRASGRCCGR